jgi:hypothetical protein
MRSDCWHYKLSVSTSSIGRTDEDDLVRSTSLDVGATADSNKENDVSNDVMTSKVSLAMVYLV